MRQGVVQGREAQARLMPAGQRGKVQLRLAGRHGKVYMRPAGAARVGVGETGRAAWQGVIKADRIKRRIQC